MTEIYLVRHGQASFGKKDYDNLSEIGEKQAFHLGEYFKSIGVKFNKIVTGSLKRQKQTCDFIKESMSINTEPERMPLLNEYDVLSVLSGYVGNRNLTDDEKFDKKVHFYLLRDAVNAWTRNEIKTGIEETWSQYESRASIILNSLNYTDNSKKVLVVSSGGTISMILKHVLNLPSSEFVNFHMQLYNSSVSKIKIEKIGTTMTLFNSISHLDILGNANYATYV